MASEKIEKKLPDFVIVDLAMDNVTLTANKTDANDVDFSSLVNSNIPSGYSFDHIEYVGVWPKSNWTNVIVTQCQATVSSRSTSIKLATMSTQAYNIKVRAWYKKSI